MSREQLEYEQGWVECRRCRCRRPAATLEVEAKALVCRDRAWCDGVVLWREELVEEAQKKPRRTKRRG